MASIGIDIRPLDASATRATRHCDDVSLSIPPNEIFGIIGPANSGKTTLLKCINRTIDFVGTARVEGHGARGRPGRAAGGQRV